MAQQYACKMAAHEGVARCRNMEPCSVPAHRNGSTQLAPRPDVVLLKINLNKKNDALFDGAGVPRHERSDERRAQLGEQHRERAERLGRDSLVIRERREGKESIDYPEAHDSGTPVFGANGLHGVSVRALTAELQGAGYHLVHAHRLAREVKPPVRLVMVYERSNGEEMQNFPWRLLADLTNTSFGQVDVWANDRDGHGKVVHTVNCGKRDEDARSQIRLLFKGGDWEAQMV